MAKTTPRRVRIELVGALSLSEKMPRIDRRPYGCVLAERGQAPTKCRFPLRSLGGVYHLIVFRLVSSFLRASMSEEVRVFYARVLQTPFPRIRVTDADARGERYPFKHL